MNNFMMTQEFVEDTLSIYYLPEEVDRTLVKRHPDGGEDDKLEQEAKEEGNKTHQ